MGIRPRRCWPQCQHRPRLELRRKRMPAPCCVPANNEVEIKVPQFGEIESLALTFPAVMTMRRRFERTALAKPLPQRAQIRTARAGAVEDLCKRQNAAPVGVHWRFAPRSRRRPPGPGSKESCETGAVDGTADTTTTPITVNDADHHAGNCGSLAFSNRLPGADNMPKHETRRQLVLRGELPQAALTGAEPGSL